MRIQMYRYKNIRMSTSFPNYSPFSSLFSFPAFTEPVFSFIENAVANGESVLVSVIYLMCYIPHAIPFSEHMLFILCILTTWMAIRRNVTYQPYRSTAWRALTAPGLLAWPAWCTSPTWMCAPPSSSPRCVGDVSFLIILCCFLMCVIC